MEREMLGYLTELRGGASGGDTLACTLQHIGLYPSTCTCVGHCLDVDRTVVDSSTIKVVLGEAFKTTARPRVLRQPLTPPGAQVESTAAPLAVDDQEDEQQLCIQEGAFAGEKVETEENKHVKGDVRV